MALSFHNRHHDQWQHSLSLVSLDASSESFQTQCSRWSLPTVWSWQKGEKLLARLGLHDIRPWPVYKKKKICESTCIQFCCHEKHECLLPSPLKVLQIFEDIHVAPTFSFLWDKQLQIPYLLLIFCFPDPSGLWPSVLNTHLSMLLWRSSPEQDIFSFHPP